MRIRDHLHRLTFYAEAAVELTRPHIQLLVDIFDIIDGGQRPVLFDDLQSDIAQLKAMGIDAEIIYRILIALRLFPLHRIRDLAAFQLISPQGFLELVIVDIGKAMPSPSDWVPSATPPL